VWTGVNAQATVDSVAEKLVDENFADAKREPRV